MKPGRIFILLLVVAMLFASCKKPELSFTLDQSKYTHGDSIRITIASKDVYSYVLEYNGERLITNRKQKSLPTDRWGDHEIRLTGYSRFGKKLTEAKKTVFVEKAKGRLLIFAHDEAVNQLFVELENTSTSAMIYNSNGCSLDCSSNSCPYLSLDEGLWNLTVVANGKRTRWSYNVIANQCNLLEVFN